MANTPQRLGQKIYEALGVGGDDLTFLGALEAALLTADDDTALQTLSQSLQSSKAEALADMIYPVSPVIGFFRHQTKHPDWKFGTYVSRRALIEHLWRRATALRTTAPDRSRLLGQGALLLAAQEAFQFAYAAIVRLVNDPRFDEIAQWPADQVSAVRGLLDNERKSSANFIQLVMTAAADLQFLIDDSSNAIDRGRLTSLLEALSEIIVLSAGRPHQQWRVANFCWRIANLARSKSDTDAIATLTTAARSWASSLADPHFDRWLDESLSTQSPPPKTVGFQVLTASEFQNRVRHQPSLGGNAT